MSGFKDAMSERFTPALLGMVLKAAGIKARLDKNFRKNLYNDMGKGVEPWRAKLMFRTRDNSIVRHVIIDNGRIRSGKGAVKPYGITTLFCQKMIFPRKPYGCIYSG